MEIKAMDKIRALIIEDNPLWLKYMFEMLGDKANECFEFKVTDTLQEGLRIAKDENIQLIFLDLILPDSQGVDTIRTTLAAANLIPIVVITALADVQIKDEAMLLGVQDFLIKDEYDEKVFFHTSLQAVRRSMRLAALEVSIAVQELHKSLVDIELRLDKVASNM